MNLSLSMISPGQFSLLQRVVKELVQVVSTSPVMNSNIQTSLPDSVLKLTEFMHTPISNQLRISLEHLGRFGKMLPYQEVLGNLLNDKEFQYYLVQQTHTKPVNLTCDSYEEAAIVATDTLFASIAQSISQRASRDLFTRRPFDLSFIKEHFLGTTLPGRIRQDIESLDEKSKWDPAAVYNCILQHVKSGEFEKLKRFSPSQFYS